LEEGPTYAFLQWYPPNISRETQLKTPDGQVIDSYTLFLTRANDSIELGATITTSATTIGTGTLSGFPAFRKQLTDIPARQFHPDGALQYKVTDLRPYTNYSVEVAAVSNSLGMSDPSNRIVFTTAEVVNKDIREWERHRTKPERIYQMTKNASGQINGIEKIQWSHDGIVKPDGTPDRECQPQTRNEFITALHLHSANGK
uniref:Fibronectin type-III domain-containing protein n=1 Tax=Echinostoma caproni TaxID=27848 RepID=A0A183ARD1_9TREM